MERFKVSYNEPRPPDQHVLLPVSLGPSSMALLDMCVEMIRAQKAIHRGRQGFFLHVVHVMDQEDSSDTRERLERLRERYPECEKIEAVKLPESSKTELVQISRGENISDLDGAMKQVNKTGREDSKGILRKGLIEKIAERNGCQTTIYGHCQTRLAELVIAMTSKGRGSAMPHAINDGGYYPLKDVLSSEVDIYNDLQETCDLIVSRTKPPANVKLQSIDDLVHQYFISVEKDFPSVVSTVVRTANKLASQEEGEDNCSICGGIRGKDTLEWIKKITVNAPIEDAGETLCYGCMVMLRNSADKLQWPRYSVQDIVNEYEL
ncbi:hypothetical protein TRICI_003322 [Trichomonascus ciferrii]|uniref:Cytoplasmic tRNA 2-thiolation protein 2 n=1 Tax=Trichomonascus ciferrii TaxID=44093 RepID=A0A642V990_9ASCO|nr:hypothetical protein TRICI_003322 [Trichomonascus ciferrii]